MIMWLGYEASEEELSSRTWCACLYEAEFVRSLPYLFQSLGSRPCFFVALINHRHSGYSLMPRLRHRNTESCTSLYLQTRSWAGIL